LITINLTPIEARSLYQIVLNVTCEATEMELIFKDRAELNAGYRAVNKLESVVK